jgi:hypothetical protein
LLPPATERPSQTAFHLGRERSRMKDDASQFFVFQREHALRFGVQFHLDDGQWVCGGEVALSIPPAGKRHSPKGMLASASAYN